MDAMVVSETHFEVDYVVRAKTEWSLFRISVGKMAYPEQNHFHSVSNQSSLLL